MGDLGGWRGDLGGASSSSSSSSSPWPAASSDNAASVNDDRFDSERGCTVSSSVNRRIGPGCNCCCGAGAFGGNLGGKVGGVESLA